MNEVWKKHPRFMEYYEVSNLGRVRMLEHYDKLGRLYKEHILNARPHKNGKNRKEISEKMKGIPKSFETRKKISETLKNK